MQQTEPTQRAPSHASGNPDWGSVWDRAMRRGDFPAAFQASDAVLRARPPGESDQAGVPYHQRWVWDGRALAGRHVLVRCYHGLGDTLQFCRFWPALRRVAASVTVEVQPELLAVLHQVPGVDRLHGFDPAVPLPRAECDVEVMELSHALRLPPDPAPYLRAEPWDGAGGVGFCWAGGTWDMARTVPPTLLAPMLALPGLRPVSLQRGAAAAALPVPDPLHGSMDVARMARLLAGLDAVVTVDTMIAHLAGALGRPVFLLLKHDPDWRWGTDGTWYQTVRPYRQTRAGEWHGAVAALTADLAATLAETPGGNSGRR